MNAKNVPRYNYNTVLGGLSLLTRLSFHRRRRSIERVSTEQRGSQIYLDICYTGNSVHLV